jgi:hypothetical protein
MGDRKDLPHPSFFLNMMPSFLFDTVDVQPSLKLRLSISSLLLRVIVPLLLMLKVLLWAPGFLASLCHNTPNLPCFHQCVIVHPLQRSPRFWMPSSFIISLSGMPLLTISEMGSTLLLTLAQLREFYNPFFEPPIGGYQRFRSLDHTAHRAALCDMKLAPDNPQAIAPQRPGHQRDGCG